MHCQLLNLLCTLGPRNCDALPIVEFVVILYGELGRGLEGARKRRLMFCRAPSLPSSFPPSLPLFPVFPPPASLSRAGK